MKESRCKKHRFDCKVDGSENIGMEKSAVNRTLVQLSGLFNIKNYIK